MLNLRRFALALHVAPLLCFVRPSMRPGAGSSGREASAPFPQGAPGAAASCSLQTKRPTLGAWGLHPVLSWLSVLSNLQPLSCQSSWRIAPGAGVAAVKRGHQVAAI